MGLVVACSSSTTAPTTTAAPITGAPTTTVPGTAFDCRDPIGVLTGTPDDYQVVGDAVALLSSAGSPAALQTSRTSEADPAHRLFAKTGLLVRAGAKAELLVPPTWSGRLAVAWGNTATEPTEHLVIGSCEGADVWLAYPGGYYVRDAACIELVVRVDSVDTVLDVGVGAPCPGQQPPPEPTET